VESRQEQGTNNKGRGVYMKKTVFFVLALFAVTGLFAQERTAIAVFPFEDMDKVFSGNEAVLFYRRFTSEFAYRNNGRFRVVPRQDVEKLINTEAAFQLSDFSAREKTAEMQRVLNGTQILSGYIGKRRGEITISIALFTYPELEQLVGVDLEAANVNQLFDKIPSLVQTMQDRIAERGAGTGSTGTNSTGTNSTGTGGNTGSNTPPPPPAVQVYKIGDTGPAGGIIFYDKGFTGDGWRYLEAAPAGAKFTAEWGAYKNDVPGTMTSAGFGRRNTQIIADRLRALRESNKAAQICAALDINGYKDWFLPSRDELDLMYKNLKQKGLGGFSDGWYWSSSQLSGNRDAWGQRFSDGSQSSYNKDITLSVRAVRAF